MSVFIDLTLRLFINSCLYIQVKIKLLYLLRFLFFNLSLEGELKAKPKRFIFSLDRTEGLCVAGSALPPALLTPRWKMDCNNNCWPSGHWAVKELLCAARPAEQLATGRPVLLVSSLKAA